MPNCIECNNKKGILRKKLNKIVCKDCMSLNKYILISWTKAKKEYFLKDDDLVNLKVYYGAAAFGNGIASYCTKEQLIQKACEIHNTTPEQLENILTNIFEQKQNSKKRKNIFCPHNGLFKLTPQFEKNKQAKRTNELIKALEDAGLELRSDSVLCKKYIESDTDYTLDECVERMCQMKYLFEYCHMNECKSEAYKEYQEVLMDGCFPDFTVFNRAEGIALNKYSNGCYPNVYPWQIEP